MPILDGRDPAAVRLAAQRLAEGGLVAFPTETVYGLGARADDDAAVGAIFAAKGRPADHPLIVHVPDLQAAAHFAPALPPAALRLADRFWPGPVTLIVPRLAGRGQAAAGGQSSIGLRRPSHPVAQALLAEAARLGVPGVAGPSANRFGRVSPTTAAHVAAEFDAGLLVLDGGACDVGIESAIVDCSGDAPALLRPGGIDRRVLEQALGMPLAAPGAHSPRASGTLVSHYAPRAKVVLWPAASLAAAAVPEGVAVYSRLAPAASARPLWRGMPADPAAVAHELFAVLRDLDDAGAVQIWVESPPPGTAWDGVRDRLSRAAAT